MPIDYNAELHCGIAVTDLDRSVAWYRDVLGFTLRERIDPVGLAILQSSVPGVVVGLSATERPVVPGSLTLTWGVTDIEAARATLEAHDVKLDGPINHIPGVVKLQGFYDPDGNSLMFWAEPDAPSED